MEEFCTGLCSILAETGADPGLALFLSLLVGVLLVSGVPLITVILLIWIERKVAARIQDRIGPNRVGPVGLLQTIADMIKLLSKEDITPTAADRVLYNAAPLVSFASVVLLWAVIPFTPFHYGVDLEIGALYFVAIASFGTLAIMAAGWASNNKYALLGAFRVVALLVSYEVPLVFALLAPVLLAGSMSLVDIVNAQNGMWFVVLSPLAFVIFYISSQAETGRAPFDLIEAESELVAGFNIEYSGMKFGMFFAAEFLHVFTNGIIMAILFFGGWMGPLYYESPLIAFAWLGAKGGLIYFTTLWLRNTVPRLRIDQIMAFNWKFLVPLSIANLIVVSFVLKVMQELQLAPRDILSAGFGDLLPTTIILLLFNGAMILYLLGILRKRGREARRESQETRPEFAQTATVAGH
ncbi:MAG: NADH-quinone oxidoreductase subunit NuoH [Chloroflexota bacterium]|nr:NADH-quinone oxidoreductase subunit NuoH [Chloroflexota bacterium]MDE2911026.1 NADH-quinone oxidoreductase subunit NuoH [Chloroflexota bacterium]